MSVAQKIRDLIRDYVTIKDNPEFEGLPPVLQWLLVNSEISRAVVNLRAVILSESPDDDQPIIDGLLMVYDDYFVPIDLPLNDVIEGMAEGWVRNQLPVVWFAVAQSVRDWHNSKDSQSNGQEKESPQENQADQA